jgi:hypothetical protein
LGTYSLASHFTGFPTAPVTCSLFANPSPAASDTRLPDPSPAASNTHPLQPGYTFAGEEHHEASERQVMLWFTL